METKLHLNDETIEGVQSLIQANLDSAKGYHAAAEAIDNAVLRETFETLSTQRSRQAAALQSFVALNDEEAEHDTSTRGAMHRAWMRARGAINGGDEEVLLIEIKRGESSLRDQYESILKDMPGNAMSDVLHQQYATITADYKKISRLRELYD